MMKHVIFAALFLAASNVAAAQDASTSIPVERIAAIAGDEIVLLTEVEERIAQYAQELASRGQSLPNDSAAIEELRRQLLDRMINDALMVQLAKNLAIEVSDEDLAGVVERRLQAVKGNFPNEAAFRDELRRVGFGTPDEFRRRLLEQERRSALQQRLMSRLQEDGKLAPVPVTDEEVSAYFTANSNQFPRIPSTVSFRQIIITPRASDEARAATRAKAESLLVEIRRNGDFESVARRESEDPGTKDQGGDLGWRRRSDFVPEFETMMLAVRVGQPSPVFETTYGFHILRVDRVQAGEYKVRHILLRPDIDSADVQRARMRADSVALAWRGGAGVDTLTALYHDPGEDRSVPEFLYDSLPPSYRQAFEGKVAGDVTEVFELADPLRESPKFVVAQLTSVVEAHEATLEDMKVLIRSQLSQERAVLRLIRNLRDEMYVRVLI